MEINFEKIKNSLSIEEVLDKYGLGGDLMRNRYKLYGKCPIHKGDNPTAFHVDIEKNLWNCFTNCGGGSVIDLLMKLEDIGVYEAGVLGEQLIHSSNLGLASSTVDSNFVKNKPLEFRLALNYEHEYLKQRKITKEIAEYFDIGYCEKGIMTGKIAIAIHDLKNNLVAYCGRTIDGAFPKYTFPFGFKKGEIVYNLNREIKNSEKKLVIVEGFFDVYRLHQSGISSAAIMGSSMTHRQKEKLDNLDKELILMFDGDHAGQRGMAKAFKMLEHKENIRKIHLPDNVQPEGLSTEELRELILRS